MTSDRQSHDTPFLRGQQEEVKKSGPIHDGNKLLCCQELVLPLAQPLFIRRVQLLTQRRPNNACDTLGGALFLLGRQREYQVLCLSKSTEQLLCRFIGGLGPFFCAESDQRDARSQVGRHGRKIIGW